MRQDNQQSESVMILGGDAKEAVPVTPQPGQAAAGISDGSGNSLPTEKSPKDDDESFDAG